MHLQEKDGVVKVLPAGGEIESEVRVGELHTGTG